MYIVLYVVILCFTILQFCFSNIVYLWSSLTVSVAILSDDFLLVTDSAAGAIYQIGRDGGHVTELDLNVASQVPVAVDYDPDSGLMYWTDINSHAIRTSKLDGSDSKILVQMSTSECPMLYYVGLEVGILLIFTV